MQSKCAIKKTNNLLKDEICCPDDLIKPKVQMEAYHAVLPLRQVSSYFVHGRLQVCSKPSMGWWLTHMLHRLLLLSNKGPQARLVEMMVEHLEERKKGEYWDTSQVSLFGSNIFGHCNYRLHWGTQSDFMIHESFRRELTTSVTFSSALFDSSHTCW